MELHFRPALTTDLPLIYNSWLKEYYYSTKYITATLFNKEYHKVIEYILSYSSVMILCNKDEIDHIIGYIVYTNDVIHWIYIKSSFRLMGLGRKLLQRIKQNNDEVICTHYGHIFKDKRIVEKYKLIYNPFSLYKSKGQQ